MRQVSWNNVDESLLIPKKEQVTNMNFALPASDSRPFPGVLVRKNSCAIEGDNPIDLQVLQ
jgi:hypothetical protein